MMKTKTVVEVMVLKGVVVDWTLLHAKSVGLVEVSVLWKRRSGRGWREIFVLP